jgi:hypothetical protein
MRFKFVHAEAVSTWMRTMQREKELLMVNPKTGCALCTQMYTLCTGLLELRITVDKKTSSECEVESETSFQEMTNAQEARIFASHICSLKLKIPSSY